MTDIDPGFKLIQDWKDYDESLISAIGDLYYKAKGIDAYATKIGKYVPNDVTNCYPHAYSLAELMVKLAKTKAKVRVLDLGCGSGIFARHFLIACEQLGIKDKVEIVLGDYSSSVLKDIKEKNILKGFDNYEFAEINALEPKQAKTLDGKNFSLGKFDLITMNYLYDALPTIVLKPDDKGLQKLQFRFLTEASQELESITEESICNDLDYVNKLLLDARWVDYDINEQNALQKKYFDYVKNEPVNQQGEVIYSYGTLEVTDLFLNYLTDEGILYAAEMPNRFNSHSNFSIFGNSAAHHVNESLIINTFIKRKKELFFQRDVLLNHFFFANKKEAIVNQQDVIEKNFVNFSQTDVYQDHKLAINSINSPFSRDLFRILVKEMVKLDKHSCFSKVAQAQDQLNFGEIAAAKKLFEAAKEIDFLDDYNLDERLRILEDH